MEIFKQQRCTTHSTKMHNLLNGEVDVTRCYASCSRRRVKMSYKRGCESAEEHGICGLYRVEYLSRVSRQCTWNVDTLLCILRAFTRVLIARIHSHFIPYKLVVLFRAIVLQIVPANIQIFKTRCTYVRSWKDGHSSRLGEKLFDESIKFFPIRNGVHYGLL